MSQTVTQSFETFSFEVNHVKICNNWRQKLFVHCKEKYLFLTQCSDNSMKLCGKSFFMAMLFSVSMIRIVGKQEIDTPRGAKQKQISYIR